MHFTLRVATAEDQIFLGQVYLSNRIGDASLADLPIDVRREFCQQQFESQVRSLEKYQPEAVSCVVEVAGEPAGRLVLNETLSHLDLLNISLLPSFQGAGLGTQILEYVISIAETCGKPACLCLPHGNPLQSLFAKLGFLVMEQNSVHLFMEKPLEKIDVKPKAANAPKARLEPLRQR